MIADVWTTGWVGLDYAGFQPGDSVAIFGAGPVGLLSAYSAMIRGASRVYSIDHVPARLEVARSIGAIPINFNESDPVAQIMAYEPDGVIRVVDCVGFEGVNAQGEEQSDYVFQNMIAITAQRGGFGVIGVYRDSDTANSTMGDALANVWNKQLTMGSGIVLPQEHVTPLVELINNNKASPGFVVSADIGIEQVPEYFARYNNHEELKIVIHF
jgi:threonine dehydrogenase-like Zn-dependent dehydrogenase